MEKENFSLAWWNTSLAPGASSRATSAERMLACGVIDQMIQMGLDLIVLCEVSDEDIEHIRQTCVFGSYRMESMITNAGRSSFDTCLIFNNDLVNVLNLTSLMSQKGNRVLKYAQRLDLAVGQSKSLFHLFISHWPSRLWCQEDHADRDHLGLRLRDAVEAIMAESDDSPHIILLGDYNDEPFAASLGEHLMATRDRNLASRKQHLLYNPFWRNLAASGTDEDYFCGSYFYKSGNITQWHTFDQIIFSHAFVAAKEWRLNESSNNILCQAELLKLVTDQNNCFDHLPVMAEMEKVN